MKIATRILPALCAAALFASPASAASPVEIRTGDVDLFYRVYDAAHGAPTAAALQHDYIDAGTEGVRQFVPHRIVSGAHLAEEIAKNRADYDRARACLKVLPRVKARLAGAFALLARIDPQATFPPVTILIGAHNSGGTTGKSGVLIGLEVMCSADWLQPDLADRLTHLIAHEYGHVEQAAILDDKNTPTTVLRQSLIEGVAELIARLTSGSVSNAHLAVWTRGHERAIDEAFLADKDSADLSHWLYNGPGTPAQPGDLGYWEGYRIAKAFYDRAADKRAALRTLLDLKDPAAILAESGWEPGAAQ